MRAEWSLLVPDRNPPRAGFLFQYIYVTQQPTKDSIEAGYEPDETEKRECRADLERELLPCLVAWENGADPGGELGSVLTLDGLTAHLVKKVEAVLALRGIQLT